MLLTRFHNTSHMSGRTSPMMKRVGHHMTLVETTLLWYYQVRRIVCVRLSTCPLQFQLRVNYPPWVVTSGWILVKGPGQTLPRVPRGSWFADARSTLDVLGGDDRVPSWKARVYYEPSSRFFGIKLLYFIR